MSRARWPFAEKEAESRQARPPAPSMLRPGTPRVTPGIVRVKLTKFRPFRGRVSICVALDGGAQVGGRGLEERGAALDVDDLHDLADAELEVDPHLLVHAEPHVREGDASGSPSSSAETL